MKRFKRLFTSVALALILVLVIASPILADTYLSYYPITITDTSGAARTGYPVLLDTNGQELIDAGLVISSGLNSRASVGDASEAANNIPYTISTTKIPVWIETLPANGQAEVRLYTGYSPNASGFDILVGDGGKITVSDDAALELGDNFEIEIDDAYIDTGAGGTKNLVYKQDAFRTYVSAASEITSEISNIPKLLYYDTGDDGNVSVGDDWGANQYDAAQSFTTTSAFTIDKLELYMNQAAGGNDTYTVSIRLMGATPTTNAALTTGTGTVTAGTNWIEFDVTNYALSATTQYAIVIYDSAGDDFWREDGSTATYAGGTSWTQINDGGWVEDADDDLMFRVYMADLTVTATGVSSGEIKVKTTADGTDLKIYIDDIEEDSIALSGASVPDNGNGWLVMDNSTTQFMSYMSFYKHTVSSTLIAWYEPNTMLTTTALVDRQGGDEGGTITWGTNTDVTLTYGEVIGYASTASSAGVEGGYTAPEADMPTEWYGTGSSLANLPLYGMINGVATSTGIPTQTIYTFMILGLCFAFSVAGFLMFNSVTAAIVGTGIGLGIGNAMTVIPMWIFFTYIVLAIGILYLKGRGGI